MFTTIYNAIMLLQMFLIVIYIFEYIEQDKKNDVPKPIYVFSVITLFFYSDTSNLFCFACIPASAKYTYIFFVCFFFQRKKFFWHNSSSPEWDYIKWKACFWQNFLSFFSIFCIWFRFISLLLILILFVMSCMMRPKQYILLCKVLCINVLKTRLWYFSHIRFYVYVYVHKPSVSKRDFFSLL